MGKEDSVDADAMLKANRETGQIVQVIDVRFECWGDFGVCAAFAKGDFDMGGTQDVMAHAGDIFGVTVLVEGIFQGFEF